MKSRKIIEIDEEKCTGCGQCVTTCAEAALAIIDGKAKLVSDIFCDGLGACLGECPEGALKIVEKEAGEFDEEAVEHRIKELKTTENQLKPPKTEPSHCGCPSAMAMNLKTCDSDRKTSEESGEQVSELTHWPIKLQLLSPHAPFLKGADLLLLADCTAASFPNLHSKLLKGKCIAMGCPKLDDLDAHIERLTEILAVAVPKSLTVVHMEVPCCSGFMHAAEKALEAAGVDVPLKRIVITRNGFVL